MLLTRIPSVQASHAAVRHAMVLGCLCLPLAVLAQEPEPLPTVKRSPAIRVTPLDETRLSDNAHKLVRALVGQSMALSEDQIQGAARIIAGPRGRVLFGTGDRIYAVGTDFAGQAAPQRGQRLRIFRATGPLKDPGTGAVLGQETQFLGDAVWVSGVGLRPESDGPNTSDVRVPASLDIVSSEREITAGDRVLMAPMEPPEELRPHWPAQPVNARVLRLYGLGQQQASQNQVITINKGRNEGIEVGHLLSLVTPATKVRDTGDPIQEAWLLPRERSGTVLVFSVFERFSYALISESADSVRVGDSLVGP